MCIKCVLTLLHHPTTIILVRAEVSPWRGRGVGGWAPPRGLQPLDHGARRPRAVAHVGFSEASVGRYEISKGRRLAVWKGCVAFRKDLTTPSANSCDGGWRTCNVPASDSRTWGKSPATVFYFLSIGDFQFLTNKYISPLCFRFFGDAHDFFMFLQVAYRVPIVRWVLIHPDRYRNTLSGTLVRNIFLR